MPTPEWVKQMADDKPPLRPLLDGGQEGVDFNDDAFVGLDLGQSMDPSALVGLRRRTWRYRHGGERPPTQYTVGGIKRWPLKTPYTVIVAELAALVGKEPLAGCVLGVDRTGCGQPVLDMIAAAKLSAKVVPVLITAGHEAKRDDTGRGWHVPKRELCSAVSVLLQTDRLDIPANIPLAEVLGKELQAFRAKISTSGNETLEADWRQRQHDDIVLGLAIAAWLGEHTPRKVGGGPSAVGGFRQGISQF